MSVERSPEEWFGFLSKVLDDGYWEMRILIDPEAQARLKEEHIRPPKKIYNGKAFYFPVNNPRSIVRAYENHLADEQWEYPFSVYVGYNPRKEDIGKASDETNVKYVQVLHLDIDTMHPHTAEEKKKLLQMGIDQIKFKALRGVPTVNNILEKAGIKPAAIIYSGLGFQELIVLSKPVTVEEGRILLAKLTGYLERELSILANKTGQEEMKTWLDSLIDTVRIMRFPGSINPKLVNWMVSMHEGIITQEMLEDWLYDKALETEIIAMDEDAIIDPEKIMNLDVEVKLKRRSLGGSGSDLYDRLVGIVNKGYILPDNHYKLPTLPLIKSWFPKWNIRPYDNLEEDIAKNFARLIGNSIGFRNYLYLRMSGWLKYREIHVELMEKIVEKVADLIGDDEKRERMRSVINTYYPEKMRIAGKYQFFKGVVAKDLGLASDAKAVETWNFPAREVYRIAWAEVLKEEKKIDEKQYWQIVKLPMSEYAKIIRQWGPYMRDLKRIVRAMEDIERQLRVVRRIGFYQLGTHAETDRPKVVWRPEDNERNPKKYKKKPKASAFNK